MKKETSTIKVIKNFDGFRGILIETVERIICTGGYRNRKGRPQTPSKTVSYKGKRYSVFMLSESYGEIKGLCISIEG